MNAGGNESAEGRRRHGKDRLETQRGFRTVGSSDPEFRSLKKIFLECLLHVWWGLR